jgi:hypothetical protein
MADVGAAPATAVAALLAAATSPTLQMHAVTAASRLLVLAAARLAQDAGQVNADATHMRASAAQLLNGVNVGLSLISALQPPPKIHAGPPAPSAAALVAGLLLCVCELVVCEPALYGCLPMGGSQEAWAAASQQSITACLRDVTTGGDGSVRASGLVAHETAAAAALARAFRICRALLRHAAVLQVSFAVAAGADAGGDKAVAAHASARLRDAVLAVLGECCAPVAAAVAAPAATAGRHYPPPEA